MYAYETEKAELFTDSGQRMFLQVRDRVKQLLRDAGAFREAEALRNICGSSWTQIACIDRLVELGEIVEIKRECWSQYRVFTTPETHSR